MKVVKDLCNSLNVCRAFQLILGLFLPDNEPIINIIFKKEP